MRRVILTTSILMLTALFGILETMAAEPQFSMNVWPGTAPGEKGLIGDEEIQAPRGDKPVQRITNVTRPTLAVYKPAKEIDTGTAIVICPGGAYNILAYDLEGIEVAEWLNSIGVTGVLLKYRVPRRADLPKHLAPLQDAQRTVSLTRTNADKWGIREDRIGVLGFSAGGHLSACTATNFDARQYPSIDNADVASCRPDFAVLVYPAYLQEENVLVPELPTSDQTPPVFFAHADNDKHSSENSIALYLALKAAGVPCELHIYADGGHGFGLRPTGLPCAEWPVQCEAWMKNQGLVETRP